MIAQSTPALMIVARQVKGRYNVVLFGNMCCVCVYVRVCMCVCMCVCVCGLPSKDDLFSQAEADLDVPIKIKRSYIGM